MKRRILIISILFFFFVLNSCGLKKTIKGTWLIEKFYYEGNNVEVEFSTNAIVFDDERVTLPGRKTYQETTWELIKENGVYYIKFDSNQDVFIEKLKITLYQEGGLNKMDMTSKNTRIKMSKSII